MHIFNGQKWRFIDETTQLLEPIHSFAIDDTLCASVGEKNSLPTVRTWVHHRYVVLGIQDCRLPFIQDGNRYLKEAGYQICIRNSGGLAVVLDDGIFNISLILKEDRTLSINSGYEAMYELVCCMLEKFHKPIYAGEIVGSYCPGSYDLSINGRKFAGISQRRVRGGVAVQIYLCVNGSGGDRAAVVKQFYEHAVKDAETKIAYPKIVPSTMASLNELLQIEWTTADLKLRLIKTLLNHNHAELKFSKLQSNEFELYEENIKRMIKRNEWLS